jgi:hypothetical protein
MSSPADMRAHSEGEPLLARTAHVRRAAGGAEQRRAGRRRHRQVKTAVSCSPRAKRASLAKKSSRMNRTSIAS